MLDPDPTADPFLAVPDFFLVVKTVLPCVVLVMVMAPPAVVLTSNIPFLRFLILVSLALASTPEAWFKLTRRSRASLTFPLFLAMILSLASAPPFFALTATVFLLALLAALTILAFDV